jgi:hypothetical protein
MTGSTNSQDGHKSVTRTRRVIFVILVVLSIIGIGIMEYSQKYALWYWLSMAPLFGGASLGLAWKTAHETDTTAGRHIRRQTLHWLVLVVGLLLVFLLDHFENLPAGVSGLIALLMLGVTTVLAGVHFEWRMGVLGAVLLLTFVAGVFAESFFWVLLIPALISLVLVLRGKGYDKV